MKTAVISGGNGGLGRALAKALRGQGWRVFLLDLSVEGLETTDRNIPTSCDLTDVAAFERAAQEILALSPRIDLVVYNAGVTQIGPFEDLSEDALRRVMEVNFFAAARMAKAFLASVRAVKGVHLAISSVAGFSPLYHRTAYSASKHALEGFFASLRSEETVHGVATLVAAPSFVATNVGNEQRQKGGIVRPGSASDGIDQMTPEQAAKIILHGMFRRTPFIPVGRVARLSYLINRLSPRLYQHLMQRKIKGSAGK